MIVGFLDVWGVRWLSGACAPSLIVEIITSLKFIYIPPGCTEGIKILIRDVIISQAQCGGNRRDIGRFCCQGGPGSSATCSSLCGLRPGNPPVTLGTLEGACQSHLHVFDFLRGPLLVVTITVVPSESLCLGHAHCKISPITAFTIFLQYSMWEMCWACGVLNSYSTDLGL